ncbi:MAG TPA: response regulator transcription factor [Pyrinomonadaceae bacterium]|nr:response regulator transcription factor [Pyrinomonadaceae bacterium]
MRLSHDFLTAFDVNIEFMRLLVVEDEKKLAAFIKRGLEKKCGHAVDVVHDGEEGLVYGLAVDYDLIILDIMLPRRDGLAVLRELRFKGIKTPILLLTAKATIESKVEGLDSGSDDYLTKPFDLRELVSRVNALLRRNSVDQLVQFTISDLTLDPVKRIARRGERTLELTAREFSLLEYLMRKKGHALSRSQIMDHVWSGEFEGTSNIVDVYIKYLRGKVDLPGSTKLIHTVWGVGYRLGDNDEG